MDPRGGKDEGRMMEGGEKEEGGGRRREEEGRRREEEGSREARFAWRGYVRHTPLGGSCIFQLLHTYPRADCSSHSW